MTNIPSVCIMIPTYNQANYLVTAVKSALAQDYCNMEIVIADDNSTDHTAEVIKQFIENPVIKYKKNSENLGRVANYRKCLTEYTRSNWVLNLDGDDYFTNPQFISQAMQAIQANGINDTLFYQGVHILKYEEAEKFNLPNIIKSQECITSKDYFFKYFERNYFSHMSTLYNRQLAIENDFYGINIISSDIFSFLSLCLKFSEKKVIVSKNIAGIWLQHDKNTSRTLYLKVHWNNFGLYIKLYCLAIENGYDKLRSFKWLIKAGYNYWAGYILKAIEIFNTK
jgi:glycosyltransferase involved in cell wall biosynthesis